MLCEMAPLTVMIAVRVKTAFEIDGIYISGGIHYTTDEAVERVYIAIKLAIVVYSLQHYHQDGRFLSTV